MGNVSFEGMRREVGSERAGDYESIKERRDVSRTRWKAVNKGNAAGKSSTSAEDVDRKGTRRSAIAWDRDWRFQIEPGGPSMETGWVGMGVEMTCDGRPVGSGRIVTLVVSSA